MTALESVVRRLIQFSPTARHVVVEILGPDYATRADFSAAETLTLVTTHIAASMVLAGVSDEERYRHMHEMVDLIFEDPRPETIACRDELARLIADGFGYDLVVTETPENWHFFFRPKQKQ